MPASKKVSATFRTVKLSAPGPEDWPMSVQESMEEGKVVTALRALVGDEQFDKLRALDPEPTLREVGQILESIASASGVELGKSGKPSPGDDDTEAS